MANSDEKCINLNLYFDGSKDESNPQVGKEDRIIQKDELVGEIIMQELIKGPSVKSKLKPIFPNNTRVLSFSIKDGIAYANLSSHAKYAMTKAKEKACLKSIIMSLSELQSVNKVKIMIDNKNVESLGGNFNISKPFSKEDVEKM